MKTQAGFTLIEALATGLISTVLATAVISMLYMTNQQIKDGGSGSRLENLQAAVSEQIRRSARNAYGCWALGEVANAANRPAAGLLTGQAEIRCYDSAWNAVSGYRLGRNFLETGDTTNPRSPNLAGWRRFTVGDDTLHLDSAASAFTLFARRKGVALRLNLFNNVGTDTVRLVDSIYVLCRN